MNVVGKILLKTYQASSHTIVGAILSGFVALFSSQGRLYLKDGNNNGDRLLSAGLQYITDSVIIAKLQVESNWTRNIYNAGDIDVGEFSDVIPGQRAVIQIPAGAKYYSVEVLANGVIVRSSTTYQDTYSKEITISSDSGVITASEHKLIPADDYHITVYKYDVQEITKTEISYSIEENGNISWSATPSLPPDSKIIIRL